MDIEQQKAVEVLYSENASCVIVNRGESRIFRQRGVRDLYEILKHEPELLKGAFVADKVVGKGAAALMILGGVSGVYADVVSRAALALMDGSDVQIEWRDCVDHIINRAGTGMCPVELLCNDCVTADECLPLIGQFIEQQQIK